LFVAGCEPLWTSWSEREEYPVLKKANAVVPPAPSPLQLKVMTWNIKYGAGRADFWFDLWGDETQLSREQVEKNMAAIYALINEVKPDILLTNEIEVNSRRSAYYDMVKGILDHTDLNFAAYTPTWQNRTVPSEGVGRINMGNAIFSRFPIERSERIPQPDRTDLDPASQKFYLHRAIGRAVVDVGGQDVAVYVIHTEAYDQDRTNKRQQDQMFELLKAETLPFVAGGDFNALPPGSVKVSHFNDEHPSSIGTDFEQPPYDPEDLRQFYDAYQEAIPLSRYGTTEAEQRRYYTHSVIGPDKIGSNGEQGFWTRRLDYLFIRQSDRWVDGSTTVLQQKGDFGIQSEPLLLSDHAPVLGTWEVVK
ncbi:MAG: endonuclease/exonuclease/phosphatase family protein, partial [Myxococcales bacterium]